MTDALVVLMQLLLSVVSAGQDPSVTAWRRNLRAVGHSLVAGYTRERIDLCYAKIAFANYLIR